MADARDGWTDILPVLIWMSGPNKDGIHFNKTWLAFTGRKLEQELGEGWLASIHPDDVTAGLAPCVEAFAERKPFQTRFRLRRADGVYRWMHDTGVPRYEENGDFLGYVGSCIDVTEQKVAQDALEREQERLRATEQALREADQRKDDFLAILGHELRNPLAAIAGALEIMHSYGDQRPPVQRAREIAERQVAQLARLTDDLHDVARITRGTVTLQLEPVDVVELLKRVIDSTQTAVAAKRHELEMHAGPAPLFVQADAARLEQMITNLVANAVKYTQPGGKIQIAVSERDGAATIVVRDSGVGIAPEMLARIFEPFVQAVQTLDRREGGLGMGLTIVSELAKLHRGSVEAQSTLGQGSEFVLRLPLAGDSEAQRLRAHRVPKAQVTRKRVLVVDDNVDSAELIAALITRWGHHTEQAHDGPGALKIALDFRPDVVLLDIGLPGMDGYEVARRLRATSAAPQPRIIAVTGYGREGDRLKSATAGFDAHLVKPVDFAALERELAD
jgi:two-component system CheB/CheR fusion protein